MYAGDIAIFPNSYSDDLKTKGYSVCTLRDTLGLPKGFSLVSTKKSSIALYHPEIADGQSYEYGAGTLQGEIMQHPYCCGSTFLWGLCEGEYSLNNEKTLSLNLVVQAFEQIARKLGYSTMQYIATDEQDYIRSCFDKRGWKVIHQVENQRTDAMLFFYQLDL
jgi:hypothetical protein